MDDSMNIPYEVVQPNDDNNNSHTNYHENPVAQNCDNQNRKVQNIVCFWTVGLCNGFGWFVMLSAVYDIFKELDGNSANQFTSPVYSNHSRECMKTSPALLLLAHTLPAVIIKIALPFFPFHVNANILTSCLLASVSFIIVAMAQHKWQAIVGIVLMSVSDDLGHVTAITYLAKFIDRKNIILAFSSAIGASGVVASLSYVALIDVFKTKTILYMMLIVPLVEFVAFSFIKESNAIDLSTSESLSTTSLLDDSTDASGTTSEPPLMTLSEKRQYLPKLIKYFIPLLINHICKHTIVQMYDLLYIPDIWLKHAAQYRWLQVIGHIGSFVGRSSLPFISIDDAWPMNLLIASFTIYLAFDAIYMPLSIPGFYHEWIIFLCVFLVGFICGCTNLSIYHRLTNEVSSNHQVFAVCSVSIGVTVGVIVASFVAMPIHQYICDL